ncbi:SAV_2336 N-terminal domain-related protein [Streptomyces sp. NPDC002564]|uniref:SAV_2336 N-terminal domain-related protein n=1 Tax=Streptomyces sp. NPDC002564 TaxID=3364649 RepID=UPI0036A88BDC
MRDEHPAPPVDETRGESAGHDRSEQLRRALTVFAQGGVDLAQEELLDVLWLAARLPPGASTGLARLSGTVVPARSAVGDDQGLPSCEGPTAPPSATEIGAAPREPAEARARVQRPEATGPLPEHGRRAAPEAIPDATAQHTATADRTPLYGGATRDARDDAVPVRSVRAPGARAFGSRQLQLARALRPLKQTVADRSRWELDETATAESTAHSGLTDAVLRPARARWLDLTLLVDDGASMLLWQQLTLETRLLLERSGAFRDVRVHGLDTRTPGAPLISRRPFTPGTAALPPATVTDPGGNTLILVLSDGIGAAWHNGRMRELLGQWARFGPTAVLHALPPHLWDGSGIRAESWRVTSRRRGAPNLTWDVADPVLLPGLAAFDDVAVPVLTPEPGAIGAWADLLASPGASTVLPLLRAPFTRAPETPPAPDAERRVLRFRDTASPTAYRLAAHLAAVAPASVPVMRLVQEALGPDVNTGHLAEVFLSGLLRRCDDTALAPQHRSYDVTTGIRDILLGAAPVRELLRTSRTVTDRLGDLTGRSADFPAWLAHPDGTERAGHEGRPFGWLDARLLRRLGVGTAGGTLPAPPTELEPPEYVDAPDSPWLSLLPHHPRRVGPWQLFARHVNARTTSGMFLGRRSEGNVAAIRVTRARSVRGASLHRQAEALRVLRGARAPRLIEVDAAPEPSWLACELHLTDGRPTLSLESTGSDGRRFTDPMEFARLGHRLATVLADAHVRGFAHGDLTARRVLLAPDGDVCVTGWCVQEHADGIAHDISKLGLTLLSASGDAVPAPFRDIVRRCSSPLLHERPSADEVATHFGTFVAAQAYAPAPRGSHETSLAVPIGRDQQGTDVVLDFRAMGPHGVVQGTGTDRSTLLEEIVGGLAARLSPAEVRFHLLDSTDRFLRSARTSTLPHLVTGTTPTLESALGAELERRRELTSAARAAGAPRPALASLIVVREAAEPPGGPGGLDQPGVHYLLLEGPGRGPVGLDFRIDLAAPGGPVLHYAGASRDFPFRLPLPQRLPQEAQLADQFGKAMSFARPGKQHETLGVLERIRARQLEYLGPDHPQALATRCEIGRLELALGRLDEALESFSDCATGRDTVLGREHPDTLVAHQLRAYVLHHLGRHKETYTICRTVLRLWENIRDREHPDTLLCRHNLVVALNAMGRYREAVPEAQATHSGRRAALGSEHPDTLASGHELAVALSGAGQEAEALAVAATVHEARSRVLGSDDPATLATLRMLPGARAPEL